MIKHIKEIKFFNPIRLDGNEESFINSDKFQIELNTESHFVEITSLKTNEVVYTTLYNIPYYKLIPDESKVIIRKKK